MATLGEPIWPDVEYRETVINGKSFGFFPVDFNEESRWVDEQIENQPEEKIKGRFIFFPVGDGKAIYKVEKLRPLTIRPVMVGDCWEIPDAYVRGLTKADIEQLVHRDKRAREIFGNVGPLE